MIAQNIMSTAHILTHVSSRRHQVRHYWSTSKEAIARQENGLAARRTYIYIVNRLDSTATFIFILSQKKEQKTKQKYEFNSREVIYQNKKEKIRVGRCSMVRGNKNCHNKNKRCFKTDSDNKIETKHWQWIH